MDLLVSQDGLWPNPAGCERRLAKARADRGRAGHGVTPDRLLSFESAHPRHDGTKEEAIRAELGLTPARYYLLLGRAARSIDGMRADAVTARRVRDRLDGRAAERVRRAA